MNTKRTIRWLIFGIFVLSLSAASFAQIGIGIAVRFGPPALPVYTQPVCPGPGYLWTPGYWAWSDDDGYYWVPGTWVLAPIGLYWTPGYWGWNDGVFVWYDGYWGPEVGFYGGINYGFGYTGEGFWGGEWRGGGFYYNRAVMNVNTTNITNVYERTVVVNNNHVAFNGGDGGVQARPTSEQERYAHEHHTDPVATQREQARAASHNRALFASENHGRPAIAATARPGDFKSHVVAARAAGAAYHAPAMSPREARAKPGENRQATTSATGRGQAQRPKAEQRNQEKQARQDKAQQQETQQKNAERQQAEQQKAEQKNAERQQAKQQKAEQQKAEQKNAERQQAKPQKAEPQNAERQAKQQQAERQNAARQAKQQKAEQQKAEQKNAEHQQAKQQKAEPQHEQKQQRAEQKRGGKPEKGPGR